MQEQFYKVPCIECGHQIVFIKVEEKNVQNFNIQITFNIFS